MNEQLSDGRYPLFAAVSLIDGAAEWTQRLLARGAKHNITSPLHKMTALMYAISCRTPDSELNRIFQVLIEGAEKVKGCSAKQYLISKDLVKGSALTYISRVLYLRPGRYICLDAHEVNKGVPPEAMNGKSSREDG